MQADRNTAEFFDLVGRGLAGVPMQDFVDKLFADKYANPQTNGFVWDDKIQILYEYKQLKAKHNIHAMATYVDRKSDAPYKSLKGVELTTGSIPVFKSGYLLDEDTIREQWAMLEEFGKFSPKMRNAIMSLMFQTTDHLIGGNHKTLEHQRHSIISTGKLEILDKNNPAGLQNIELDFSVPKENKVKLAGQKRWWTDEDRTVEGTTSDPLRDLKAIVKKAKDNLHPVGNFEVSIELWEDFVNHTAVRKVLGYFISPLATTPEQALQVGFNVEDSVIKARIEAHIKMPITIVDSIVSVERWNKEKMKIGDELIRPFSGESFVLVPSGNLGTIKSVRPYHIPSVGCRHALFDGGRTLLTETFDAKAKTHTIASELSALCVPDKTDWFYYLTV